MRIQRMPLLCPKEIRGAFRYHDLFQLLPASPEDPRPPFVEGPYGLTIEIHMDDQPCPDREKDMWAHDIRERRRYDELRRKVKSAEPDWWKTEKNIRKMHRPNAIVGEVVNLLSTLTRHSFTEPQNGHVWVLDTDAEPGTARYMQLHWPTFGNGPNDALTAYTSPIAKIIPADDYWRRLGAGAEDTVEFPDDVEKLVGTYLTLPEQLRVAFARACELARNGREIWLASRSLSLIAAVFAIDGLAHATDPAPTTCPECSQMTADQKCKSCGGPRYGLTARFRQFVESHADVGELRQGFASDLYGLRSAIAHRGGLLREDEFDSGFTAGGSDSQWDYRDVAFTLTREVLRGWLCTQAVTH